MAEPWRVWVAYLRKRGLFPDKLKEQNASLGESKPIACEREEVEPPWVEYPGFGPGDGFWRQGSGESFFYLIWEPYYESLSEAKQADYLERWKVPEDWQNFYFSKEWREWLESTNEIE